MKVKYFIVYNKYGIVDYTGEHFYDLNPDMVDAIHDSGRFIKSATLDEIKYIKAEDETLDHFIIYDLKKSEK